VEKLPSLTVPNSFVSTTVCMSVSVLGQQPESCLSGVFLTCHALLPDQPKKLTSKDGVSGITILIGLKAVPKQHLKIGTSDNFG
jgi:hypothetical protein